MWILPWSILIQFCRWIKKYERAARWRGTETIVTALSARIQRQITERDNGHCTVPYLPARKLTGLVTRLETAKFWIQTQAPSWLEKSPGNEVAGRDFQNWSKLTEESSLKNCWTMKLKWSFLDHTNYVILWLRDMVTERHLKRRKIKVCLKLIKLCIFMSCI